MANHIETKRGEPSAVIESVVTKRGPRGSSKRRNIPLIGAYLPVGIVVIWQVICGLNWVTPEILPSPVQIVEAFVRLTRTGELVNDVGISLLRMILGFLLGASIGLITGLFAGLYRRFEEVVDPSVQMLRTVPHLAITPLFILWLGLGEWSKDILIATGAFFPMYINTFMGIRNVDSKLFDVARILEFSRMKQLTKLVLPAALPNILLGLRLALGVSWLGLVVAEMLGSSSGVGYLILNAQQFSETDIVFVGIIIFAVVGKLSDSIVRLLERRWLRWRDSYTG
ncbi:ABC transporter permease [Alicyclobacillus fastidiosus]